MNETVEKCKEIAGSRVDFTLTLQTMLCFS